MHLAVIPQTPPLLNLFTVQLIFGHLSTYRIIYFVVRRQLHLPEVVMVHLFPTGSERGAGTTHLLLSPPPSPPRHANVYLHGVFSGCSLNSTRRRSLSVEHGKGRAGGAGENNGQEKESRFCFASRKVPSGARKGKSNIFARGLGHGVGYRE